MRDVADAVTRIATHYRTQTVMQHRTTVDTWTPGARRARGSARVAATFYHTGAWLALARRRLPAHDAALCCRRHGQRRAAIAFLPYFESRRGPLRALWSLPFGTYGGPVGDERACDGIVARVLPCFRHPVLSTWVAIDGLNSTLRRLGERAANWRRTLSTSRADSNHRVARNSFDKPRRRRCDARVEAGVDRAARQRRGRYRPRSSHVYRERLQGLEGRQRAPGDVVLLDLAAARRRTGRLYVAGHGGKCRGGHLNFYYKDAVIAWYGMTSTRSRRNAGGDAPVFRTACARLRGRISAPYNLGASLGKSR